MSHVESAIHDARIQPDERGLVPLEDARRLVATVDVYRKGDGEMIDGTFVLESDRVWAALLSLADADEFLREALRIRWEFHVRGHGNIAAVERYGAGVLPWIAANVDARGVLRNVPWCLLPCLLAIDGDEAFELALSVRGVSQDLRVGPGAYAADSAGDVDREGSGLADAEPGGDDVSVARSWVVARSAMDRLERHASRGDARAARLLDELRPAVDPRVAELVASCPRLDVAPGPSVTLAELDESARSYDLPIWDNTNYSVGAMRATGFVSPEGDALVLEVITHWPSASQGFAREITVFGPGARSRSAQKELVPESQLGTWLGDSTRVSLVTGVLVGGETVRGKWRPVVVTPPGGINPTVRIAIGKEAFGVWTTFPEIPDLDAHKRELARRVDPSLVVLFHLAEPGLRDKLFLGKDELARTIGAPKGAQVLFSFDDWEHPRAGDLASSSIDLATMVVALGTRAKIDRLLGRGNGRFHHWLEHFAEHRGDPDAWGDGDPIDDEKPTSGISISPQHDALMDRGWPHLVSFVHAHPWNEPKKAVETATQILADGRSMFRVTWARDVALRTARALGASAKSIAADDPKVAEALARAEPLTRREAAADLARATTRRAEVPPALVEDHVLLLEAIVGPETVIDAVLGALDKLTKPAAPPKSALAVLFAVGFVIARAAPEVAEAARKRLRAMVKRWPKSARLARLADVIANDVEGAKRGAVDEAWLVHVRRDPAFVRERVAASTEPLVPDARFVATAGPEILDAWRSRLDAFAGDPAWFVVQIGMLRDARALDLLLTLAARGIAAADAKTWLGYRPFDKERLAAIAASGGETAAIAADVVAKM